MGMEHIHVRVVRVENETIRELRLASIGISPASGVEIDPFPV